MPTVATSPYGVAHAGSVAVRLLADRVGPTGEVSKALARASFMPVHDRGRVLVDDGGEAISDTDVLRHQGQCWVRSRRRRRCGGRWTS